MLDGQESSGWRMESRALPLAAAATPVLSIRGNGPLGYRGGRSGFGNRGLRDKWDPFDDMNDALSISRRVSISCSSFEGHFLLASFSRYFGCSFERPSVDIGPCLPILIPHPITEPSRTGVEFAPSEEQAVLRQRVPFWNSKSEEKPKWLRARCCLCGWKVYLFPCRTYSHPRRNQPSQKDTKHHAPKGKKMPASHF